MKGEKVVGVTLSEILEKGFKAYATETVGGRAIPSLEDGLKPVQRRILYSMKADGFTAVHPHVKSSRVVGNVMGGYHPHGDCLHGSVRFKDVTGRVYTMEEAYKEYSDSGREMRVYCRNDEGEKVVGCASSFRIGQYTKEVYRLTFLNGEEILVTGNHPFYVMNKGYVKAENLRVSDMFDYYLETEYYMQDKEKKDIKEKVIQPILEKCDELGRFPEEKDWNDEEIFSKLPTKVYNYLLGDFMPFLLSIEKIELEEEIPMYDFTVCGYENMYICVNQENTLHICAHNSSIYDTAVRMSKDWMLSEPLTDIHGNNGSIDGDPSAHMRYCVTAEGLLDTNRGYIPIQKIVKDALPNTTNAVTDGISVTSEDGRVGEIDKFFHCGKHLTQKIRLLNGIEIAGTLNHPIKVIEPRNKMIEKSSYLTWLDTQLVNNEEYEEKWKLMEDIEEGDYVVCYMGSSESNLAEPSEADLEQARLLGCLIGEYEGEGHLSKKILNATNTEQIEFLKYAVDALLDEKEENSVYIKIVHPNGCRQLLKDMLVLLMKYNVTAHMGMDELRGFEYTDSVLYISKSEFEKISEENITINKRYYPIVKKEETGYQNVYSISVKDSSHAFVLNGVLNHNTEIRLSELATDELTGDVLSKKSVVDWTNNYDDTKQEPELLPAKFPNLIVNGASGMAVGYATDILPHNLRETMNALVYIAKNGELSTLEGIMEELPAPDFPTGGVIVGGEKLGKVYSNGRGSVKVRARYEIEKRGNRVKKEVILIKEIPFGVNKETLVKELNDKIRLPVKHASHLPFIESVVDESDRRGLQIAITCTTGADISVVLGRLFTKTGLTQNLKVNHVAIEGKRIRTNISLLEMLNKYHQFRKNILIKELNWDKKRYEKQLERIQGNVKFYKESDKYLKIIRESENKQVAKENLLSYGFTEYQADNILAKQVNTLTKGDYQVFEEELPKVQKSIAKVERTLKSDKLLTNTLIKDYERIAKKYGKDRKTSVIQEEEKWEVKKEDLVVDEEVYVSVTYRGNVKRSSVRSYASSGGEFVVDNGDDYIIYTGKANTKDTLLIFTNKGRYLSIPVYILEDMSWKDLGKTLAQSGSQLDIDEFVIGAVLAEDKDTEGNMGTILYVTSVGNVKRTWIKDMVTSRQPFKLHEFLKLKEDGERLVKVVEILDEATYLAFKDDTEKTMYFKVSEESIPVKSRKAGTIRGVKLGKGATEIDEIEVTSDYIKLLTEYVNERNRGQVTKKKGKLTEEQQQLLARLISESEEKKE